MKLFGVSNKKTDDYKEVFDKIYSEILTNKDLREEISMVCAMEFFNETIPLAKYIEKHNLECNFNGIAFAKTGYGIIYAVLEDNTIGFIDTAEGQCGRIAKTLKDLLELEINCKYAWNKYINKYSELTKEKVNMYEEEGLEHFEDTYEVTNYDEMKDNIARHFKLHLSNNILDDVLVGLCDMLKVEPEIVVIEKSTGNKFEPLKCK